MMLAVMALGTSALLVSAQDNNNDGPPGGPPPDSQSATNHVGGRGGPRGFHLLPPPLVAQLKLTDDQKQQVVALEAETKAKLEKILTTDQLQQLKNFRPPMRDRMGGPRMRGGNGPGGDDNMPPSGPPSGDSNGDNDGPPGPPPADN